MKSYLLLSIIPLLLIVPGIAFGEDSVPLKLELNKYSYEFGEPILFHIEVERLVPNTPIVVKSDTMRYDGRIYEWNKQSFYGTWVPDLDFHQTPTSSYDTIQDYFSKSFKIESYYGRSPPDHFGYDKKNFNFVYNAESKGNKLVEFMPTDLDIGTTWTLQWTQHSDIQCDSFELCYDIGLANEYAGLWYMQYHILEFDTVGKANEFFELNTKKFEKTTISYTDLCKNNESYVSENFKQLERENKRNLETWCLLDSKIIVVYVDGANKSPFSGGGKYPYLFWSLEETELFIKEMAKKIFSENRNQIKELEPETSCREGFQLINDKCVIDKNYNEQIESSPESSFTESSYSQSSSSQGGGCLIATATFDSELAPQVQKLREIRDSKLLQTESGSQFMESFNQFYYSFSPIIADYERENPVFKEIVKVGITPMLSTLSLMDYADTESEVLGIGISLIILNAMMYVGLPVFGIMRIRK